MARILIVEDEAIQAASTSMLLEEMGHEVLGVADRADRALSKAAELRPDVVLTDIILKGKTDGIDLAHELILRHGCRIIFMTGSPESLIAETLHDAILHKPFRHEDLESALEVALKQ